MEKNFAELMMIIRDWNTTAKYAKLAHLLLFELINIIDISNLEELKKKWEEQQEKLIPEGKKGGPKRMSLEEIIDILVSYSERHFSRVRKHIKHSFYLDFFLQRNNLVEEKHTERSLFTAVNRQDISVPDKRKK
jgi:hypothetical protein